jgi:hypothetical protein
VSAEYYFGKSANVPVLVAQGGAPTGATAKASESSLLYGVDVGYNFSLLFLTLRPVVGVGNYTLHKSGAESGDVHNVYVQPGAMALIGIGLWFFGGDANVLLTPGLQNSKAAFTANGQVGVKF